MTEIFNDKDQEVKVTKNEDGSFQIGDKKYKDVDALLRSKVEADNHIRLVEQESREKNSLLSQREEELKLLKQLDERLQQRPKRESENEEDENDMWKDSRPREQEQPKFDPDEIADSVYKKIEERTAKERQRDQFEANKQAVSDAIVEAFDGDEDAAREAFQSYKKSEDYDEDIFNSMMLKRPKTLAKLIASSSNPDAIVNFGSTPSKRPAMKTDATGVRGWSHWKELLKSEEGRRKYYTPETQQAMRAEKEKVGVDKFMKL